MSSAIFRELASGGDAYKPERVFRAAVSAFAALARPTAGEIVRLDDLTLPLLPRVPVETRRYAAAALCECNTPPPRLLRRLCEEPIDISAPLLVRSMALTDVDLIGLIAQHGLPHARLIGRRANLNPAIAALIRAISALHDETPGGTAADGPQPSSRLDMPEQAVREKLRAMMRDAAKPDVLPLTDNAGSDGRQTAMELSAAALSGDDAAFASILADKLGVSIDRARLIIGFAMPSELMTALRLLGLDAAEALLITAAHFPAQLSDRATIRLFVARYGAISAELAKTRLQRWRQLPSSPSAGGGQPHHHSAATSK
ncbi:hypothetical protein NA2_05598 [Nitratireductor pacificus pht-3B]|uniref:DUF2336 domain-containing protein n=1 Tax=Nitratireductor pacificus pht-3B TaxID=391937 RepID=K2MGF9_9HYPH|nr:hypothetical protein NA2_05598 [Nitratireductor pacificus pht-3B]